MVSAEPIFITTEKGQKIRILAPDDYDALFSVITKDRLRTLLSMCFWTGMRYVETQRLYQHPEWVVKGGRQIRLNHKIQQNPVRTIPERCITVPPQIEAEMEHFFKNKQPPSTQNWNNDLTHFAKKAGLGEEGITPRMTRVSIESWMCAAGLPESWICPRQGYVHKGRNKLTSLNSYQGLPFSDSDIAEIKCRIGGWKD